MVGVFFFPTDGCCIAIILCLFVVVCLLLFFVVVVLVVVSQLSFTFDALGRLCFVIVALLGTYNVVTQFPVLQFFSWFANQLFTHFGSAQSILNYSESCKLIIIRSRLEQCDYLSFAS